MACKWAQVLGGLKREKGASLMMRCSLIRAQKCKFKSRSSNIFVFILIANSAIQVSNQASRCSEDSQTASASSKSLRYVNATGRLERAIANEALKQQRENGRRMQLDGASARSTLFDDDLDQESNLLLNSRHNQANETGRRLQYPASKSRNSNKWPKAHIVSVSDSNLNFPLYFDAPDNLAGDQVASSRLPADWQQPSEAESRPDQDDYRTASRLKAANKSQIKIASELALLNNDVRVRSELIFVDGNSSVDGLASRNLSGTPERQKASRYKQIVIDLDDDSMPVLIARSSPANEQVNLRQKSGDWPLVNEQDLAENGLENEVLVSGLEQQQPLERYANLAQWQDDNKALIEDDQPQQPPQQDERSFSSIVYPKRKLELTKSTSASSGIRVTTGEGPTPLIINSSGLIVAAKRNSSSSRPTYNPSQLLTSQMDHSLSPISINSLHNISLHSGSQTLDFEQGNRHFERPTFLKKPLLVSGTIWRQNATSSTSRPQFEPAAVSPRPSPSPNPMSQLDGQSAELRPSYSAQDSGGQLQLISQSDAGPETAPPVNNRNATKIAYDDQRLYTLNRTQSGGNLFNHNPPYKQQLASVDLDPQLQGDQQNCTAATPTSTVRPASSSPKPAHQSGSNKKQANRKPAGANDRVSYELSTAQSQQQNRFTGQANKVTSTTPIYDTTTTTSSPIELISSFNSSISLMPASSAKPSRIKNRLQSIIIGKILKSQLNSSSAQAAQAAQAMAAAYSGGQQQQQQLAVSAPPPLLSSTVANNVASLLAQKLSALVRPYGASQSAPSAFNSLFGIRVPPTSPVNKFKQRLNPFNTPTSHSTINRRTTGVGSLLFSGFIYGLSVLPALMALTGINPLNSESAAPPTNRSTAAASRFGAERARRPLQRPQLAAPEDPLSSYAYLVPLVTAPPLESSDLDSISGSDAQQSAIKSMHAPPQAQLDQQNSIGSLSELQALLDESPLQHPTSFPAHLPTLRPHLPLYPAGYSLGSASYAPNFLQSSLWPTARSAPASRHTRAPDNWFNPAREIGFAQSNLSDIRKPFDETSVYSDRASADFNKLLLGQSNLPDEPTFMFNNNNKQEQEDKRGASFMASNRMPVIRALSMPAMERNVLANHVNLATLDPANQFNGAGQSDQADQAMQRYKQHYESDRFLINRPPATNDLVLRSPYNTQIDESLSPNSINELINRSRRTPITHQRLQLHQQQQPSSSETELKPVIMNNKLSSLARLRGNTDFDLQTAAKADRPNSSLPDVSSSNGDRFRVGYTLNYVPITDSIRPRASSSNQISADDQQKLDEQRWRAVFPSANSQLSNYDLDRESHTKLVDPVESSRTSDSNWPQQRQRKQTRKKSGKRMNHKTSKRRKPLATTESPLLADQKESEEMLASHKTASGSKVLDEPAISTTNGH